MDAVYVLAFKRVNERKKMITFVIDRCLSAVIKRFNLRDAFSIWKKWNQNKFMNMIIKLHEKDSIYSRSSGYLSSSSSIGEDLCKENTQFKFINF